MVPFLNAEGGPLFSCQNQVGTWTVSAEGDYVWNWPKSRGTGGIGSQVTFAKLVVAGEITEQMPETAPTSSTTANQQVIIGIAGGIVIIGSVIFFFARRRRGRAA